jgi:streptogramin lyase
MSAFCGLVVFLISFLLVLGSAADAQTAHFSGANITLPIGAVTNPWGMAVDTNGNVYVADNAANSLSKLTPSGVLTSMSGEGSPYGVALDAAGNLYITDEVKNEVVKETPQQQGSYYSKSVLPLKGLNGPTGVAVDLHGNVYVADSGNNRVVKATPFGNTYTQSLVPGSPLSYPEGVAVDGSGNLYIADSHHFRVLKETPSGSNWSESVIANLENEGAPPIGVAADVAGDVFILDYLDDEDFSVFKETLSGGVYTLSNLRNVGPNPYGIAADAAGDVYLVSPGSNQLVKEFAGPATDFGIGSVKGAGISISLNFTFDTPGSVGSAALLTLGGEGLDFTDAGTGTCTTQSSSFVYNPGDTCSVDVVFQPRASGSRYGAVQLQNEYTQTFATTYLFGTGVAPQITFPPGKPVSITSYLENPSGVPAGFSGVAVDSQGSVFFAESGTGYVGKGYVPPVGSAGPIGFNTVAAGLRMAREMSISRLRVWSTKRRPPTGEATRLRRSSPILPIWWASRWIAAPTFISLLPHPETCIKRPCKRTAATSRLRLAMGSPARKEWRWMEAAISTSSRQKAIISPSRRSRQTAAICRLPLPLG